MQCGSNHETALLDRARGAKNGAKFAALYDAGDWQGQGHPSHSEGRQGLCSLIAFWTGPDEGRIEALFRRSALFPGEKKWARERMKVLANACARREFWRGERPPETPPADAPPLSTLDTPPDPCGEQDRIIADLRAKLAERDRKLAERDRRLRAIHDLMTAEGMTPSERIIAYGVSIEAASAESRKEEGEDLVINQSAVAENVRVSRQAVGGTLKRWSEYGHMRKETRHTGRRTPTGEPISETIVRLPARALEDNFTLASTWTRPEGTKHVGGNGRRCPKCAATKVIETITTAVMETRRVVCADCGHLHEERKKQRGQSRTEVRHRDWAMPAEEGEDTPQSTADTPPCPEPDPHPPVVVPSVSFRTPPTVRTGKAPLAPFTGVQPCYRCDTETLLTEGAPALCTACERLARLPFPLPLARGAPTYVAGD